MEAEAREIITTACMGPARRARAEELQAFVDRLYGSAKPRGVADELIADRRREAEE